MIDLGSTILTKISKRNREREAADLESGRQQRIFSGSMNVGSGQFPILGLTGANFHVHPPSNIKVGRNSTYTVDNRNFSNCGGDVTFGNKVATSTSNVNYGPAQTKKPRSDGKFNVPSSIGHLVVKEEPHIVKSQSKASRALQMKCVQLLRAENPKMTDTQIYDIVAENNGASRSCLRLWDQQLQNPELHPVVPDGRERITSSPQFDEAVSSKLWIQTLQRVTTTDGKKVESIQRETANIAYSYQMIDLAAKETQAHFIELYPNDKRLAASVFSNHWISDFTKRQLFKNRYIAIFKSTRRRLDML